MTSTINIEAIAALVTQHQADIADKIMWSVISGRFMATVKTNAGVVTAWADADSNGARVLSGDRRNETNVETRHALRRLSSEVLWFVIDR